MALTKKTLMYAIHMDGQYFDTLIFGASFLGLGAALSMNNCAVIEGGCLFGAEFVNCYKVNAPEQIKVKTKPGAAFWADLQKRGLVYENGDIYQGPSVYVLSRFLKVKNMDIYLMAEVIDLKKIDGLYNITVYTTKGFEYFKAKKIIETTTFGKYRKQKTNIKKCLNAIMHNPSGCSLTGLSHNRASGLYTYSLDLPAEISRYEATEKLCAMENDFALNDMRISSIAADFAYTMEKVSEKIDDNFFWYPSAGRANLIAAFDEGVYLGETIT